MGRVASPGRKRAGVESPPAVDLLRKGCRLAELRQMREEGGSEEEETAPEGGPDKGAEKMPVHAGQRRPSTVTRAHFTTLTRLAVR